MCLVPIHMTLEIICEVSIYGTEGESLERWTRIGSRMSLYCKLCGRGGRRGERDVPIQPAGLSCLVHGIHVLCGSSDERLVSLQNPSRISEGLTLPFPRP